MKILMLGNSLTAMINFRWGIIKHLADQDHQIYVVCPLDMENYQINYQYKNVSFHAIDLCRSINITKDFITLFQLSRHIKRLNPEVIFSYSLKSSFFSMLVNWTMPNVYFITGMGSSLINKYKWLIKKIIYLLTHTRKLILKHTDFFIFLNKDDRDYFINNKLCLKNRAMVFPGEGINLDFFKLSPITENKTSIFFLFIGRLIRDKGIIELMQACKKMQEKKIHFNCTVIAPFDSYNPSSLHTINLESFQKVGIQYLSYVNDVRTYIQACEVVVLPSYSEGLPRVLLESMAIGRAIIATDTHGCKELVSHENGITVKVKDVQSLYDAMVSMSMKSKSELRELGLAGYKKVKEKYSLSSVINSYQMLIDNRVNKG